MKRTFMMFLLALLMASTSIPVHAEPKLYGKQTEQSNHNSPYAKWGTLAIQETTKKYPNAKIVDYLHVGRQTISSTTTRETFKLWLKQGNREFGVYVRITFDTATERAQAIVVEETER
ncbi:YqzG/YhdC family protein [Geobacillus sp. G4]|uniref:YqzG/YhdC family protein n=1 Tax=Geobacillus sp. G4 TaxID=3169691 RepID=UPI003335FEE5